MFRSIYRVKLEDLKLSIINMLITWR